MTKTDVFPSQWYIDNNARLNVNAAGLVSERVRNYARRTSNSLCEHRAHSDTTITTLVSYTVLHYVVSMIKSVAIAE